MDKLSKDAGKLIYKKSDMDLRGEFSMNGRMISLLMLFDGSTNLKEISKKMDMRLPDVSPLVSKLLEYGVIEEVEEHTAMLDPKFFGYMAGQLSRIAGPIAKIIVQDAIAAIGGGPSGVPEKLAAELIELVAREIADDKQRSEFINNMIQKLKTA